MLTHTGFFKYIHLSLCLLLFNACSIQGSNTDHDGLRDIIPTTEKDRAPTNPRVISHVPSAVPRYEVRTQAGNKSPYKVKGVVYRVMEGGSGYSETGMASWYGEKFQGNRTSNGEVYDMYQMTAAHKTLPIPSYVKVTNVSNRKSIVVRVNDRGPFEKGRIIDLSYAGAYMLGYLNQGTALVKVEYIPMPKGSKRSVSPSAGRIKPPVATSSGEENIATAQRYLQVGAFSELTAASLLKRKVSGLSMLPVIIESVPHSGTGRIHKVQIGPIRNDNALRNVKQRLSEEGYTAPLQIFK